MRASSQLFACNSSKKASHYLNGAASAATRYLPGDRSRPYIMCSLTEEFMTPDVRRAARSRNWILALLAIALVLGSPALAADEPDLIFRRSTVFKWISPNDKLATYGVDDPEVDGV